MYRSISSLLLGLVLLTNGPLAKAQVPYLPTGVQLGIDLVNPLYYGCWLKTGNRYEWNASIDFGKVILEGDYGWGNTQWKGFSPRTKVNSVYTSGGKYFRAGLSYNLLQSTPDKNQAFLGLRYATSYFGDHLTSKVCNTRFGAIRGMGIFPIDKRKENVKARWYEVVAGVSVKVWKPLYVGCTVRYKLGIHIDGAKYYVPYEVLGWGLYDRETFGLSYHLSLRFLS